MKLLTCYVVVPLTQGYVTIIDREDWRKVRKYKWHVHFSKGTKRKPGQPYARATINGKKCYMQVYLMGAPPGFQVDHKNHQTLDNRRSENLEVVDHITNQRRRRRLKNGGKNQNEVAQACAVRA